MLRVVGSSSVWRVWSWAVVLVLVPLVLGCCTRDIPAPDNALEDPAALRAAIDARLEGIESARFKEVVLDDFGEDERVKVRQLILVERPDLLRVQTRIPGSDGVMSVLVSNGERFAMHRRDTNNYYTGAPTPRNINRLLPVDLSARDVVRVMLGGAPWDRFAREGAQPRLEWNGKTGRYRYEVDTRGGGELAMEVRHTDYAVVEVRQTDAAGEVLYAYTTDDWERHGQVALPGYRRFIWPDRDLDFSLDVGETQLGVELPEILFEFEPPEGSKIIHLDP